MERAAARSACESVGIQLSANTSAACFRYRAFAIVDMPEEDIPAYWPFASWTASGN
ncbi:MAG TPA: hypothetical protein VHQ22_20470 [Terriglobales bacterium]|nr:hypothetical protein [Terriglobales bacterium]